MNLKQARQAIPYRLKDVIRGIHGNHVRRLPLVRRELFRAMNVVEVFSNRAGEVRLMGEVHKALEGVSAVDLERIRDKWLELRP